MSAVVSFFKRFAVKFVEVIGAGIATAVTGYLLAHFSGYWSSPAQAPAAVQVAPGAGVVSKSQRAQPAQRVSADANDLHLAPGLDANPAAKQPARTTANATQSGSSRKRMTTDTSAAESKPRDMEAVEAQVRAALANVDANRPVPADAPPHRGDSPPGPSAVAAPPRPPEAPLGTADAAVPPRAADPQAQPPAPPVQIEPLPTVEIKSRPVADVAAMPPASSGQESVEEDKGLLSAIKKIPDLLRFGSPAPADEVPRPPLPVSQ